MTTPHVGGRFQHIYVIVLKTFRFKSFHSGERFQKFAVTVCLFAGCVWTKAGSVTKCLRIQTNPDTCGKGLNKRLGTMYDSNDGMIIKNEDELDVLDRQM